MAYSSKSRMGYKTVHVLYGVSVEVGPGDTASNVLAFACQAFGKSSGDFQLIHKGVLDGKVATSNTFLEAGDDCVVQLRSKSMAAQLQKGQLKAKDRLKMINQFSGNTKIREDDRLAQALKLSVDMPFDTPVTLNRPYARDPKSAQPALPASGSLQEARPPGLGPAPIVPRPNSTGGALPPPMLGTGAPPPLPSAGDILPQSGPPPMLGPGPRSARSSMISEVPLQSGPPPMLGEVPPPPLAVKDSAPDILAFPAPPGPPPAESTPGGPDPAWKPPPGPPPGLAPPSFSLPTLQVGGSTNTGLSGPSASGIVGMMVGGVMPGGVQSAQESVKKSAAEDAQALLTKPPSNPGDLPTSLQGRRSDSGLPSAVASIAPGIAVIEMPSPLKPPSCPPSDLAPPSMMNVAMTPESARPALDRSFSPFIVSPEKPAEKQISSGRQVASASDPEPPAPMMGEKQKEKVKEYVQAAYSYTAKDATQLSFKVGDVLRKLQDSGTGWIHARVNGQNGWVPSTYVTDYTPPDSKSPRDADKGLTAAAPSRLGSDSDGADDGRKSPGGFSVDVVFPMLNDEFQSFHVGSTETFDGLLNDCLAFVNSARLPGSQLKKDEYKLCVRGSNSQPMKWMNSADSVGSLKPESGRLCLSRSVRTLRVSFPSLIVGGARVDQCTEVELDEVMTVASLLSRSSTEFNEFMTKNQAVLAGSDEDQSKCERWKVHFTGPSDRGFVVADTRFGTPLKLDTTAWDAITGNDVFLTFSKFEVLVRYEAVTSGMLVDYHEPISSLTEVMCKTLGVKEPWDVYALKDEEKNIALCRNDSLEQLQYLPIAEVTLFERGDDVMMEKSRYIWTDTEDTEKNIVVENDDDLVASTFNKTIEWITSDRMNDIHFSKAFLFTYQAYATPVMVLEKLMERYNVPKEFSSQKQLIQLRVLNLLRLWIEMKWSDFKDDAVGRKLLDVFVNDPELSHQRAKKLKSMIAAKESEKDEKMRTRGFQSPAPAPLVDVSKIIDDFWDVDVEEIARQMTLFDFKLFEKIKPIECLNQAWNKAKLKHRAPNILACISRINKISDWVQRSIIEPEKPRHRAKRWVALIRISRHLEKLNNFMSLIAMVGGMNKAGVHRLKNTKKEMPKKMIDEMEALFEIASSNQSYKMYRKTLHNITPPAVPYIGVHLQDLVFIDDGNPNFLGKLINNSKFKMVFGVIMELNTYQNEGYNLRTVSQVQAHIRDLKTFSDEEGYKVSLVREPRKE